MNYKLLLLQNNFIAADYVKQMFLNTRGPSVTTHFEKFFQSVLNLGPSQRTLKFFFHSALIWGILTHFEKIRNSYFHGWLYFSF